MRRRISWLVITTASAVVVSLVIPLCLLVRTLAEDRATAAADQEARNVAILVARPLAATRSCAGPGRRPRRARQAPTRRCSPATARCSAPTADRRGARGGPRGAPRSRTTRRSPSPTTTACACSCPVVVDDGTDVVRTERTPRDELRQGVWPGLARHHRSRGGADAAGPGRRRAAEPTDQRARSGRSPVSRTGSARATWSARAEVRGTGETQELARALNGLADRTVELLAAERAAVCGPLAPAADPGDRVAARRRGGLRPRGSRSDCRCTSPCCSARSTPSSGRPAVRSAPTWPPSSDAGSTWWATDAASGRRSPRTRAGRSRGPAPTRARHGPPWPRVWTSPTSSTW